MNMFVYKTIIYAIIYYVNEFIKYIQRDQEN
jgi:hypothetical protein